MFRMITFLVGGVVGAGIAALLTPRTGEEARRELKARMNDRYGDRIERAGVRATELIQSGRETINEQLAKGQAYVNDAMERTRATTPTGTTTTTTTTKSAAEPGSDPTHQQF